ncbi:MAG: molecular chaperone [Bacteriovoracaceae bacterium]|nr:molecular chaperone [Bacteriovoracaceae bacterium]
MKLFILFLMFSVHAFAFRLTPIVAEFYPDKKVKARTFKVTNPTEKEITLEAKVLSRDISEDGKEIREKTSDFLVYPPQMVLGPGKTRSIRVSFSGKFNNKQEQAYRLLVAQLPVNLDADKRGSGVKLNFLFKYVASIYVVPKNANPNLKVESLTRKGDLLELNIENKGKRHSLLRHYKLVLKQGEKSVDIDFSSEAFKDRGSLNLLAGKNVKFTIKAPKQLGSGKLKAALIKL